VSQSRHEIRAAQEATSTRRATEGGKGTGGPDGPEDTGISERGGGRRTGWRRWVLATLKWGSIAGLAALVRSKHPSLTAFELKSVLAACATSSDGSG